MHMTVPTGQQELFWFYSLESRVEEHETLEGPESHHFHVDLTMFSLLLDMIFIDVIPTTSKGHF